MRKERKQKRTRVKDLDGWWRTERTKTCRKERLGS